MSVLFAQTVTPTFVDLSGWAVNGSAALIGLDEVELTQAVTNRVGSAWAPCKVDLSGDFDLELSVYVGGSNSASDGIGVVFQNDPRGAGAIGVGGSSEGFGDAGPGFYDPALAVKPSVDIELDTYPNDEQAVYGEPSYQHLGMMENGIFENGYVAGPVEAIPGNPNGQICDGLEHGLSIHWQASTHTMTVLLDTGAGVTYTKDVVGALFSGVSQVYWGVTGSTGGSFTIQYFKVKKGICPQTVSPTPTDVTPTTTPTVTKTYTPSISPTSTPASVTPMIPITFSPTPSFTWTGTQTSTSSPTPTHTPTASQTPSSTATPTPTFSATRTMTWMATITVSETWTETPAASPTSTPLLRGTDRFYIYPNPVYGKVAHLAYRLDSSGFVHVNVYNSAYSLSAKFTDRNDPGYHVMELDLKGAAPGVYYVSVECDTGSGHQRVAPIRIFLPGGL